MEGCSVTMREIEERLRRVLVPVRDRNQVVINHTLAPTAKLELVELLGDIERARLLGIDKP